MLGDRAAAGWARQLTGEMTGIVRPKATETPDSAAARAAETLAGVEGVAEARALEREKAEALIAPWLGDAADLADLTGMDDCLFVAEGTALIGDFPPLRVAAPEGSPPNTGFEHAIAQFSRAPWIDTYQGCAPDSALDHL